MRRSDPVHLVRPLRRLAVAADEALGEILVMRRNSGRREPDVGETVHLAWQAEHLRILAVETAA